DPAIVRVRQDFQRAAGVAAAGELHAARGKGVRVPITVHIASFDPEGQGVFQPYLRHRGGLEVHAEIYAAPVALDLRPRKRRAGRHRAVNRAAGLGVLGADFLLQLGRQAAQLIDEAQAVVADADLADGALLQHDVAARQQALVADEVDRKFGVVVDAGGNVLLADREVEHRHQHLGLGVVDFEARGGLDLRLLHADGRAEQLQAVPRVIAEVCVRARGAVARVPRVTAPRAR